MPAIHNWGMVGCWGTMVVSSGGSPCRRDDLEASLWDHLEDEYSELRLEETILSKIAAGDIENIHRMCKQNECNGYNRRHSMTTI